MIKNKLHIERLKSIRPYVNFNYNINKIKKGQLTNYDKQKIKKYYDLIDQLKAQPNYDYRPKTQKYKKQAKDFFGITGFNELKVIPIPTAETGKKPKIKRRNGRLVIGTNNVDRITILFNKNKLLKNPEKEVQNAVNKTLPDFKRFSTISGMFEIKRTHQGVKTLTREILKLMNRYSNDEKNNYFVNWMHGINAYKFIKQKDFDSFKQLRRAEAEKLKKTRRNARRRAKYKKAK